MVNENHQIKPKSNNQRRQLAPELLTQPSLKIHFLNFILPIKIDKCSYLLNIEEPASDRTTVVNHRWLRNYRESGISGYPLSYRYKS